MIRREPKRGGESVRVTFVLPPQHELGKVSVVGSFNGWDPYANPFRRRSNQTFSTAITVGRGERLHFRYLAEDGRWLDEPEADGYEQTDRGTVNCVLDV